VSGALASAVHTAVAVVVWVQYREPDFYFRGWGSVDATLMVGMIMGITRGILLGMALVLLEDLTSRRIRAVWFLLTIWTISLVVAGVSISAEFHKQRVFDHRLGLEWIPLGLSALVSPLLSRRIAVSEKMP